MTGSRGSRLKKAKIVSTTMADKEMKMRAYSPVPKNNYHSPNQFLGKCSSVDLLLVAFISLLLLAKNVK